MTTYHKNLRGDDNHLPGYVRATDPGVVGSGILWVDKSGGAGEWVIRVRNDSDDGWELSGISAIVLDTSPELGGHLDGQGMYNIANVTNLDIDQASDESGIQLYGFSDQSAQYLKLGVGAASYSQIKASGGLTVVASGNLTFTSETGNIDFTPASGSVMDFGDGINPISAYINIGPLEEFGVRDLDSNDLLSVLGDGIVTVGGTFNVKRTVEIPLLDNSTDLTTGDDFAGFYWCVPESLNGYDITDVDFWVTTVSSSGLPSFAIYNVTDSVDILSVNCTIDASEFTSYTATTSPTINTSNDSIATGDLIRFDCDAAGTGTKGCGVILVVEKP